MDGLITYGAWRMAHRLLAHGATDRATVDCYSEVMAYTVLAYFYWASFHNTHGCLRHDIDYNCHIKAIELIKPIVWGLYYTTSY